MKKILIPALALLWACGEKEQKSTLPTQPDIVVIMADDLGFSDIGHYGAEIETPNIDQLATEGQSYSQFYNAGRCCPSRASLLTGRYPHNAKVGGMVYRSTYPPEKKAQYTGSYAGFLPDSMPTIGHLLQQGGYTTGCVGKWHVGEEKPHWPLQRGFDFYYGLISGAASYWEQVPDRIWAYQNDAFEPQKGNFYATHAFTDTAVAWVKRQQQTSKPYFLYLPYTAPHWPLHAPEETIQKYMAMYEEDPTLLRQRRYERLSGIGIFETPNGLPPADSTIKPWASVQDKELEIRKQATYAAMVEEMDKGIGQLVKTIRSSPRGKNTIIIFLSDNGACHENPINRAKNDLKEQYDSSIVNYAGVPGSYNGLGRRYAQVGSVPFKLYKHWMHEGGIATPFIVNWPAGKMSTGWNTSTYWHIKDLAPTLLEAAGLGTSHTYLGQPVVFDGESMLGNWADPGKERNDPIVFWEHQGNRALRNGQFKLVSQKGQPWELYELSNDRNEVVDIAPSNPDMVAEMEAIWMEMAAMQGVRVEAAME